MKIPKINVTAATPIRGLITKIRPMRRPSTDKIPMPQPPPRKATTRPAAPSNMARNPTKTTNPDLTEVAQQISTFKGEANASLGDPNNDALRLRLEMAHAAVEAAAVEARRRVRLNEGR